MKQNNIRNIIFDLGGVLLDLDIDRSVQAFQKLGLKDLDKQDGWYNKSKVFRELEKGLLSDDQFRSGVRSLLPNGASDEEIDAAWCAMLVGFAPEKVELLKNLSLNYQLFIFSNTNSIHLTHFRKLFFDAHGCHLDDLFSKTFYSHEIKRRKPNTDSYEIVIAKAGIEANETLFIDDLEDNIKGAKQAGLHATWLKPEITVNELLVDYL